MQRHAKLAIVLVVVGIIGLVGWRFAEPFIKANTQAEITDGASLKTSLKIAVDGWVGYFPLCSPEMKKRLRRDGYGLQCIDDAADYKDRFAKLDANEYDFVVATVDSYVLNGEQFNYPGAIIAVLDESKGGDAIIARKSRIDSLETLKAIEQVNVAFTPDSPSHHLLKSVATHFDIPSFKDPSTYVKSSGSQDAFNSLKKGLADVAILWEPDVSKALDDKDFVRLLGTEDTQQLIVDILIASRRVAKNEDELIKTVLKNYFQALKFYSENKEALTKDLARYVELSTSKVQPLLDGVKWVNLSENAEKWYSVQNQGFSEDALVNSIESAVDILIDAGDFRDHPLPNRDPYRLLNSQYVEQLYQAFGKAGSWNQPSRGKTLKPQKFRVLTSAQWDNLREVGALKARKVAFSSGTSELTDKGKTTIDQLVKDLRHYPTFRVEVRGHSGLRGDSDINLVLSRARAEAVVDYMLAAHDVQEHRVRALGFGGLRPLPKKPNESDRAYAYRLPRVELVLVKETI